MQAVRFLPEENSDLVDTGRMHYRDWTTINKFRLEVRQSFNHR